MCWFIILFRLTTCHIFSCRKPFKVIFLIGLIIIQFSVRHTQHNHQNHMNQLKMIVQIGLTLHHNSVQWKSFCWLHYWYSPYHSFLGHKAARYVHKQPRGLTVKAPKAWTAASFTWPSCRWVLWARWLYFGGAAIGAQLGGNYYSCYKEFYLLTQAPFWEPPLPAGKQFGRYP